MRALPGLGVLTAIVAIVATGCGLSSGSPTAAPVRTRAAVTHVRPAQGAVYTWGRDGMRTANGTAREARRASGHTTSLTAPGGVDTPTVVNGIVGKVVAIATSNTDGYALTAAGRVYAWGGNDQGQLGNDSTVASSTKAVQVHFPRGVVIASLPDPMPYNGGLAIDTTGRVWGWGNNMARQLCLPAATRIGEPTKLPLHHVTLAAGAWTHTIFDANGRVVSCGRGRFGQLGAGAIHKAAVPTAVRGLPRGRVKALTSSWGNAGVLMADGAYYDWGNNNHGQVGDGTTTTRRSAVRVALPGAVTQVSQGGSLRVNGQTMAILADGLVRVWGDGRFGQLGNGSTHDALTPRQLAVPAGVRFVTVHSGGATDFAIASTGQLYAWGRDNWGEVGNGVREPRQVLPEDDELTLSAVSSTASVAVGFVRPVGGTGSNARSSGHRTGRDHHSCTGAHHRHRHDARSCQATDS